MKPGKSQHSSELSVPDSDEPNNPDRGMRLLGRMIARKLIRQGVNITNPVRESNADNLPASKDEDEGLS